MTDVEASCAFWSRAAEARVLPPVLLWHDCDEEGDDPWENALVAARVPSASPVAAARTLAGAFEVAEQGARCVPRWWGVWRVRATLILV